MSQYLKATTGLTGLKVQPNPRHRLNVLYGKILRALQAIPADAAYRKCTEEIVCERASIVEKNNDVGLIEKQIACGQIEELIVQAENELKLARKMVVWKPWEPLVTAAEPNQWTWPPTK